MKTILKSVAAAGLLLGTASLPAFVAPAMAAGPIIPGLGVANLEAVRVNSNAFKTAAQQRQTTYKAQIDQANSRAQQIQAQLKPLADKFEADRRGGKASEAALQQQVAQIQQLQQSGQQEVNQILQPVAISEAYVDEQIAEKLNTAVQNANNKRKISILLRPDSLIYADNGYNMNQDILNELNTLLPSAQIVPPAGWEPREIREQRAAQQRQQGGQQAAPAAAPAQPAAQQPEGR
ncbi:MAG: OmpH family outer membrane protein [Novosphingobium sp.]